MPREKKEVKKGKNINESMKNLEEAIADGSKPGGMQDMLPKGMRGKKLNLLLTVGKEKTVYSEKVHGKDYREIAKATAEKFSGTLTEIE